MVRMDIYVLRDGSTRVVDGLQLELENSLRQTPVTPVDPSSVVATIQIDSTDPVDHAVLRMLLGVDQLEGYQRPLRSTLANVLARVFAVGVSEGQKRRRSDNATP